MNPATFSLKDCIQRQVEMESWYEWAQKPLSPLSSKLPPKTIKKSLIKRLPSIILP